MFVQLPRFIAAAPFPGEDKRENKPARMGRKEGVPINKQGNKTYKELFREHINKKIFPEGNPFSDALSFFALYIIFNSVNHDGDEEYWKKEYENLCEIEKQVNAEMKKRFPNAEWDH